MLQQPIRSLQCDLKLIAHCNSACFPTSFSTKLGQSFTEKTFEWFLSAENLFLFHIKDDTHVAGYCGGFISRYNGDGSTSGMMQYAMKEAAFGMLKRPWLFFNKELLPFYPLVIKNIYRKLFPGKTRNAELNAPTALITQRKTGLVVIGVHPDYRGKGIFEMLMNEFEKESSDKQISEMYLSVKKENIRAVNAYKKVGWYVTKENPFSLEMAKSIS
ncbi:MAG TPA: GNAT family N-acetyltransferase [Panacibacter sp.]|nr:GNAT family N-acetyltransferase [Panacibacter sp.]